MGWARMDDGYMFHPKIVEAGPWAELLDRRAIEHCAKNETDGLVTRSALKLLGRGIPKVAERVTVLLEVGRWTVNESRGWMVHDFLKYNPTKAEKEAQREAGRERVRKHRSNAVTNASHSRGGAEALEPGKQRIRSIERCRACTRLDLDCECTEPQIGTGA